MLTWNVYIDDWNGKRIEVFNIFDHHGVREDLSKAVRKFKDKESFADALRRTLMYYYWSKCEWEIILDSWPERKDFRQEKIDVYDQVSLNWEAFVDYVWANRKELTKKESGDG